MKKTVKYIIFGLLFLFIIDSQVYAVNDYSYADEKSQNFFVYETVNNKDEINTQINEIKNDISTLDIDDELKRNITKELDEILDDDISTSENQIEMLQKIQRLKDDISASDIESSTKKNITVKLNNIVANLQSNIIKDEDLDWSNTNDYYNGINSGIDHIIDNTIDDSYTDDSIFNTDTNGCPVVLKPIVVFVKKIAFNTLQIFVPILLILMGTIDFVKATAAMDDKGSKEAISKFVKRALAAIIVFFVTTIVSLAMGLVSKADIGEQNGWLSCWQNID